MNEEAIKKVAACMSPLRFNLRGVVLDVDEEFEPDLDSDHAYKILIKFSVVKHACVESEEGEARLLRWYGKSGVRLLLDNGDQDEDEYKISIELDFVETYRIKPGCDIPEEEDLIEFGNHNVQYHVWPYLRELMQSYGEKIGVGPIPLPHYVVSRKG
jgi:hypothetical protein